MSRTTRVGPRGAVHSGFDACLVSPRKCDGLVGAQRQLARLDECLPIVANERLCRIKGCGKAHVVVREVAKHDDASSLTLWHVVHQPDYNRQTVSALVAAQMHLYDGLYQRYIDRQQSLMSREQTIFDRFIYLVNRHCQHEHQLSFYAQKMCLTERYLGTVIRQASGRTAKAWIDDAIMMRAKVELRHTEKSAAQIADEMHFPTPSFFSKYFKRMTGLTPMEYKRSES